MLKTLCKLVYCSLVLFTLTAIAKDGFVAVNQGKLYYQIFDQRPTIVILHGGPGLDQSYLLPQMTELSKQYRVVFYDQRGSGKSTSTLIDVEHINVEQFVQDLDSLRKALQLKQIIILGHSWGGLLAMHYAINHPQHVSAMILMNSAPATSMGFQTFAEEYKKRTQPITKELTEIQTSDKFKQFDPQTTSLFYRKIFSTYFYQSHAVDELTLSFTPISAKNSAEISNIFGSTLFSKPYDLRPQLQKLAIPTLVITGDADPIPVKAEKEMADSVKNAQFFVIRQSGHFPYIEQPNVLFSKINQFLNAQN